MEKTAIKRMELYTALEPPMVSPGWSQARVAASVMFLVDGATFGTWAALIPSFKQKFALSDGGLAWALLGMVLGALVSMPLAGRLIARWGSRTLLLYIAPLFCLILSLLPLAPNFTLLITLATLFGAMKGAMDVSVNTQAVVIERGYGRAIMSSFQGLWSLGGLLAALLVGLALHQELSPKVIAIAIASTLMLAAAVFVNNLATGDQTPQRHGLKFRLPSRRLLNIGILAFLALFAEGSMIDWSAVYSHSVAGAADWLAPFAYGMFCVAMATGRLLGDGVMVKYGANIVLRGSGALATVGMLIIILCQYWPATFIGLLLAGLGIANLVAIFLSACGRANQSGVGSGIATVTTIGYFGFLAGPPTIGGLSHLIGLPGAFLVVVLFVLMIAIGGPGLLGTRRQA